MTDNYCRVCGGEEGRLIRCRTCFFKNALDQYLFFHEEIAPPDTWDEGGIPTEKPDQEEACREFL